MWQGLDNGITKMASRRFWIAAAFRFRPSPGRQSLPPPPLSSL
jgi:hypothetical protein